MREIEIKARVKDEKKLLSALEATKIKLGEPKKQHDVVYGEPGAEDNLDKRPDPVWIRVRVEDDSRIEFTLKRSVGGLQLDSIEHEVVVDSESEIRAMIKHLGFELYSDLTKTRRKAKHDDIEICLDEVEGLGTYVEAEKLVDDGADGNDVREELWRFFESLGVSRTEEELDGYDVLVNSLEIHE